MRDITSVTFCWPEQGSGPAQIQVMKKEILPLNGRSCNFVLQRDTDVRRHRLVILTIHRSYLHTPAPELRMILANLFCSIVPYANFLHGFSENYFVHWGHLSVESLTGYFL